VIPTIGRPSLATLLAALRAQCPQPNEVVIVDDRSFSAEDPIDVDVALPLQVLRSGGRGPAAARNVGWRATTSPWVVFLDDDVIIGPDWSRQLEADLKSAGARRARGVSGRIEVPEPSDRRTTDQ